MKDLEPPVFLSVLYWICSVLCVFKIMFGLFYLGSDSMMMVLVFLFISTMVVGILYPVFNIAWESLWDAQLDHSYGNRILVPTVLALILVLFAIVFRWDVWIDSNADKQFFLFYLWDVFAFGCGAFGVSNYLEFRKSKPNPGRGIWENLVLSILLVPGALVVFVGSLLGLVYLSDACITHHEYLRLFFMIPWFFFFMLMLPYFMLETLWVKWHPLKKDHFQVKMRFGFVNILQKLMILVVPWFLADGMMRSVLSGSGNHGSSDAIVLINGVASGAGSSDGWLVSILAYVLVIFIGWFFFQITASFIARLFFPILDADEENVAEQSDPIDDSGPSDPNDAFGSLNCIFMLSKSEMSSNTAQQLNRYRIATVVICAVLVFISYQNLMLSVRS